MMGTIVIGDWFRRAAPGLFLAPDDRAGGPVAGQVPFQAHLELLRFFLGHREAIVERIEALLNAQRRPIEFLQDHARLSRHFEDCFFPPGAPGEGGRLRGRLEEAHWAAGFTPRALPGLHNSLIDPAEMTIRVFHLWRQTRWPGRNGRIRYAHTLFNLYLIRCLTLLTMRVWDGGAGGAGERLLQLQHLLDQLWMGTPAGQPVLVRDARWLIPLAQSPATDDLGAYFDVAHRIADTLPPGDRIVIHTAGVCMAAGHLRSQIHYFSRKKGVPLDEQSLVAAMRTTNALDFALLAQELVPLLDAYERACLGEDDARRRELAGVICQGISPDPELFVDRVDLLGAYSMIEHLFIAADRDGRAVLTPMGRRHRQLLQEYEARIGRVATRLSDDCPRFRPVPGTYSPYGAMYGFSSDLLEHMVLKASQPDAVTSLGLEDVFVEGGADRLAWVTGWRTLPHVATDVQKQFAYPQQFADDVFERIARALRRRVSDGGADSTVPAGRLFVVPADASSPEAAGSAVPDLPARYIHSSDVDLVSAQKAEYRDEADLEADRREGRCLVSYRTPRGSVTITKAVLTEILGEGHDAKIAGLPGQAVAVLKLMCADLAVAC